MGQLGPRRFEGENAWSANDDHVFPWRGLGGNEYIGWWGLFFSLIDYLLLSSAQQLQGWALGRND